MSKLHFSRTMVRAIAIGLTVSLAIGAARAASAVNVQTSTYAQESLLSGAQPNPNIKSQNISHPTTASSSLKSDLLKTHAQAKATAKVTTSGVVKSSSGAGWVDAGTPTFDSKSFSWSAKATGTELIINTISPGGPALVPLQIQFPTAADPSLEPGFNAEFPTILGGAEPPRQGVLRDNAGLMAGSVPAVQSDVVLAVLIRLNQPPSINNQVLFSGTATFHSDGNVTFTDSFFSTPGIGFESKFDETISPNPNALRTTLTGLPTIGFQVAPDQPFDLLLDVDLNVGDPLIPPTPFAFGDLPRNFGIAGAFQTNMVLVDTTHFALAPVPEPTGLVLAVLGGLSLAALARRRSGRLRGRGLRSSLLE